MCMPGQVIALRCTMTASVRGLLGSNLLRRQDSARTAGIHTGTGTVLVISHDDGACEPAGKPPLENDGCEPLGSPLLETYRLKRHLAKHQCNLCNVHSNLSKALLYVGWVPSGDLTHAPTDLATVRSFQVAGTFVGDTDSCRADALALITAQLKPLDHFMRL